MPRDMIKGTQRKLFFGASEYIKKLQYPQLIVPIFPSLYPLVDCSRYSDWATGWTVRVSNPGRGKRFSFFTKRPELSCGPPSFPFSG